MAKLHILKVTAIFAVLGIIIVFINLNCTVDKPGIYKGKIMKKGSFYDVKFMPAPEPPIPGMGFIPQKPSVNYPDFPEEIKNGHPDLKRRTYPKEPREDSCNGCFPYIYHTVLDMDGCEHMPDLKLLILVTTVPKEIKMREIIRETWGKNTNVMRTVFLYGVGWPVEDQEILYKESEKYGDVLQDNYVDSYYNLSLKVLSAYHWWSKHCQRVPYILRTAADNFINTTGLLRLLNSKPVWPNQLIGYAFVGGPVLRDARTRWYVHKYEYPEKVYPHYVSGTAFVVTAETAKLIIETSPDVPFFIIEDVYFGMVMAKGVKFGQEVVNNQPGFNLGYGIYMDNGKQQCRYRNDTISLHGVHNPKEVKWIWENCVP